MPNVDFDSPVITGGHFDDAAEVNAALRDADNVRIAGHLVLRSAISIPPYKELYTESPSFLIKSYSGPMIVMESGGFNGLEGTLMLEGQASEGYTGPGIVIDRGGGWQKINKLRVLRCEGPCIDMSQPHAGHGANISNSMFQRADLNKPAIVLPVSEPTTGGLRRFIALSGAGGCLLDLAGSNTSMVLMCDSMRLPMNADSRYGMLMANRIAIPAGETFDIRGAHHRFIANTFPSPVRVFGQHTYEPSNYDAGVTRFA